MDFLAFFESCRLCPRDCRVNRLGDPNSGGLGVCGESHRLRVAHVGPHFGEEPPISGSHGSGTVFFTGCSLRCSFCQNHQISSNNLGKIMGVHELFERIVAMIQGDHVHNLNFVTPDHFFPHTFELVSFLRSRGYALPVVYNLSGYQSRSLLRTVKEYADIYLPDFKFADRSLAQRLSKCRDYPRVSLEAIVEMVNQKGFLDATQNGARIAGKGVLVRHLILPGRVENSIDALSMLYLEFGSGLPLSLMSQYHPALHQKDKDLNRSLSRGEFDKVYSHAIELGFEHLFVQFPDEIRSEPFRPSPFLPDFRLATPFAGNKSI